MTTMQIINSVDHKDLRVQQGFSEHLGDLVHCCPAYTFEFRDLQAEVPILFQDHGDEGFIPVALMGFEHGENLFVEGEQWRGAYLPAFLRKGPFWVGQHQPEEGEAVRLLSIDRNHPRVSEVEGEPLFQPLGGRTDYLEEMANLLEHIYDGAQQTMQFARALRSLNLIESVTMDITLRDGSRNQLLGFYTIDEAAVKTLSGEALAQLSESGFLMPLFMMLASLGNFRRLIDLKEARLVAGS